MFGCRAGKALAAFWFLPIGIALAGAASMLFAMSNQNDEPDEDEEKTEEANEQNDEQDPEPSETPAEAPESEPEAVEPEADEQPVEQVEEQAAEQAAGDTDKIVFAAANGKVWHADRDCPTLSRAKKVKELTLHEAEETGMKACGTCGK